LSYGTLFISNKLHQFHQEISESSAKSFTSSAPIHQCSLTDFSVFGCAKDRLDPSSSLNGTSVAMPNFHNYGMWPEIFMGIDLKIDEKAGALTSDSNALKGYGKAPAQHERGTTLVEVAVAGALLVLALASLYALYGTTVKEAKGGDTAAIAQQNSIARIDQMRNLTWNNTTSPSYIRDLLTTPTSSDNA